MNIYKVLPDYENFCAFTLPMKDLLQTLGRDIPPKTLMHFYRHDLVLKNHWKDIAATFEPIDRITKTQGIPEITVWAPGTLVFSEKAVNTLKELLKGGELLPVSTPHGNYWIFNCSRSENAIESESQRTLKDGQVLDVQAIEFDTEATKEPIFKTDFDGFRSVYCNEVFKTLTENHSLQGVRFAHNLVGAF
jgi:hypothetical protein